MAIEPVYAYAVIRGGRIWPTDIYNTNYVTIYEEQQEYIEEVVIMTKKEYEEIKKVIV